MQLFHIQHGLSAAHDRIVDQSALARLDQRRALGIDKLASDVCGVASMHVPLPKLARVVGHDAPLGLSPPAENVPDTAAATAIP